MALVLLLTVWPGPPGAAAQATPGRPALPDTLATVIGRVTDHETARAVLGAAVSLVIDAGEVRTVRTGETDRDGRFRFVDLRPGRYRLTVDRLGYRSMADSVTVPPGAEVRVQAELSTLPLDLDPVVVVVRRENGHRGFAPGLEGRRLRGAGTFLTRDQIEATKAVHVSDLLQSFPGIRLVPEGELGYTLRLRGGCRPAIWIDDARTESINVDAVLLPDDIEAIEVYHSGEIPARFGHSPCGAVVFWTRTAEPGSGKASAWKRIALSAVVLAGMFLGFR